MAAAFVLLACLVTSGLGIPLESDQDVKQYLSPRIVGGTEAPPGYGEHMAALVWGNMRTWRQLMCGASIITKQHLLTAAHCIEPMVVWGELIQSFRAVIGSNRWTSTNKNIRFKGFVNHEGFNWDTLNYDIGVLFLAEDIKLGDNVAIIPLSFEWVDGGVKSYVTGWGRLGVNRPVPEKLQKLSLNTISPQECLDGIREASEGWWGGVPPHEPELEICTFHSVGHGMCHGDSGSALVQEDTRQQIGLVSWGFPCARGAPDVYVRVSSFKTWISEAIGAEIHV